MFLHIYNKHRLVHQTESTPVVNQFPIHMFLIFFILPFLHTSSYWDVAGTEKLSDFYTPSPHLSHKDSWVHDVSVEHQCVLRCFSVPHSCIEWLLSDWSLLVWFSIQRKLCGFANWIQAQSNSKVCGSSEKESLFILVHVINLLQIKPSFNSFNPL